MFSRAMLVELFYSWKKYRRKSSNILELSIYFFHTPLHKVFHTQAWLYPILKWGDVFCLHAYIIFYLTLLKFVSLLCRKSGTTVSAADRGRLEKKVPADSSQQKKHDWIGEGIACSIRCFSLMGETVSGWPEMPAFQPRLLFLDPVITMELSVSHERNISNMIFLVMHFYLMKARLYLYFLSVFWGQGWCYLQGAEGSACIGLYYLALSSSELICDSPFQFVRNILDVGWFLLLIYFNLK
jgi:hypothetical protein